MDQNQNGYRCSSLKNTIQSEKSMQNSAVYREGVKIDFNRLILEGLDLIVSYSSIYGLVGAFGREK